jgi:peptidoglycan lytic transglycosylase G
LYRRGDPVKLSVRRLAALGGVVAALVAWETWCLLAPPAPLRQGSIVVQAPAGESVLTIAARLYAAGAIRSPEAFVVLAFARGSFRSLKAGEYEVPRGASTLEVLAQLERGGVRLRAVLHPEGATVAELARALERAQLARSADVLRTATDRAFLQAQGIEAASAEGYLFPDTYHFVRGMTPEQILRRMVQRLQAKLTAGIRERARAHHLSIHELLTLASIVEREAVIPEERRLISAVFWNRLRLGMPLQADPTVQYAVGKERRALSRADLLWDHPYNTYVRLGLPPGPIASPGLDAIKAAIDPARVGYLYFVKRNDEHHHFATTLEEHQSAVARYRFWAAARQSGRPAAHIIGQFRGEKR